MKKEITIYQPVTNEWMKSVRKKTVQYDDITDKVEIRKNGFVSITLVDACVSGHNGDYYDDHESGWTTFNKAKKDLIRIVKESCKKDIDYIKGLKDTK